MANAKEFDVDDPAMLEAIRLMEGIHQFDKQHKFIDSFAKVFIPGDDFNKMYPYEWQVDFHNAGKASQERALICANRIGKSMTGAREMTAHLTGSYPAWWQGRRFDIPIRAWVGSDTNETSREIVQVALVGDPIGPGRIPKHHHGEIKYRQAGIADVVDSITVKHISGGYSRLVFKTYEQGRKKWQGTSQHIIWFDEEPPQDIYTEGLTRTLDVKGMVYLTFTPLTGTTGVVLHFLDGGLGIWCLIATWDDAPHLDDTEKARMLLSYPEHERESRSKGVPIAGSGLVYRVADEEIAIDPIEIPRHWPRVCGFDFGIDHPAAAAWIAWDRDSDCVYLYDCYKKAGETFGYHAEAIRRRGDWIPVAWPHDGMHREKSSGTILADSLKRANVNVMSLSARYKDDTGGAVAKEPIVLEIDERMRLGSFKVFKHLEGFFREKRMFHRKDGLIVATMDDILSATHYAVMMRRHGRTNQVKVMPTQTERYNPFESLRR